MGQEFFKVTTLEGVFEHLTAFPLAPTEQVPLVEALGRVLATEICSDADLPDFTRATMDGFAVRAASTFGASEANPAYLTLKGSIAMGNAPGFTLGVGEAARIATGGMLPQGADSVVMIEHTAPIDATTIEVYRSAAPGQHVLEIGEDFKLGEVVLSPGRKLRAQEIGLLAAFGHQRIPVFRRPLVGIISTGDEVVPIDTAPGPGRIRDINTYTLTGLVAKAGGVPVSYGIVADEPDALREKCNSALARMDMVLLSGGSSVGTRDFTIDVFNSLPDCRLLVHGIAISPGKPTILAKIGGKAFWGLPGHVVSAMVVFEIVVRPFIEQVAGLAAGSRPTFRLSARLTRNVPSVQGRTDFIRVRLREKAGSLWAEPLLGKSGLIHTMVRADGLIEIGMNTEGLNKDAVVEVRPLD
jgi:molybdopterin molybdotransferase